LPDKLCDEFFGVYCLISRSSNKYYKNRCYIGYTVDPNRRIRQHNAGTQFGGASRTDHRGPWDMVLIIYGFPNSVSALRFEWAWQNPDKSRRLRPLELKKSQKETAFAFRLRIVCCMLNTEPWKRLSLTLRWLMPECEIPFSHRLPEHIAIEHGVIKKSWIMVKESMENAKAICNCVICEQKIISLTELLRCVECSSHFHMECLAKTVLKKNGEYNNFLFPVGGSCPVCFAKFLWGNMIRDQRAVLALINSSSGDKLLTEVPVGKLVRT
uniref:Structure-specific endonuclease subunit SLX1 homolog n=1 Tax=Dracunculus medinensis TaxID=318479 RepID=A0A0N4UG27_DRAME